MTPKSDSTSVNLRACRLSEGLGMTSTLLALSAVAAPFAHGQEPASENKKPTGGATELPEMVVTADGKKLYKTEKIVSPKYTKPLLDTPQTVTVIPRQVIEEQGATTLTEVLRNVPGITMTGGENGNAGSVGGDAIMMRGFDASSSIFSDGVRDNSLLSRDTFNTESAEVFQGPTGSDVGRGNAAGYINLGTKVPHAGNSYEGGAQYATGDRQRYTADLNQELNWGQPSWVGGTAVRFNGVYQDGGVPGRDFVENNVVGIAPSFAWGLGTDTRAFLSYQHIERHDIPDYGLPAFRNKLAPGVDDEWFYGTRYDYDDGEQNTFLGRIEHDFSENLTLTNQTKYNQTTRVSQGVRPSYNPTTNRVTRAVVVDDRANQIFSNQTNLVAKFNTGSFKHALTSGVEYTEEKQDTWTRIGTTTFTPLLPGDEPTHGNYSGYDRGPGYSRGATETIGIYAFDTIDLSPKWILTGGLRADHYNTYYENYAIPRGQTAYQMSGPFNEGNEVYSGKVALVYKPVEEGSIYLAYSSTSTPPGTGNFSVNTTTNGTSGDISSSANINAEPQVSENIELGSKWEFFSKKLILNGAVFRTENTNFIYQSDPDDATSFTADGGQEIWGATIGATGQITENWSILGSVTYLDATLDQPGNVVDGNELARTPDWAASLWTTYKLPKGFTVGLGARCQDMVNTSTVADSPTMPGFVVFDGLAQYDVNEHFNLRLNVYNILDTNYVASTSGGGGGDTGGTGGSTGGGTDASGNRIKMGSPLSFALSANYKF